MKVRDISWEVISIDILSRFFAMNPCIMFTGHIQRSNNSLWILLVGSMYLGSADIIFTLQADERKLNEGKTRRKLRRPLNQMHQRKPSPEYIQNILWSSLSTFVIFDQKIIDILVKNWKLMNIARKRRREMEFTSIDRLNSGWICIIIFFFLFSTAIYKIHLWALLQAVLGRPKKLFIE